MLRLLGVVLAQTLVHATAATAQEPPQIEVQVRQVAGGNVYLDLGTDHGLQPGDTLQVARDLGGSVVGRIVVTAATDVRSVLTILGEPFPVTRGATLVLHLLRTPSNAIPQPGTRAQRTRAPEPRTTTPAGEASSRPATGRIALDVGLRHSRTRFGGSDPITVARSYANPALRLDVTVPDFVAGFRLRTSMRMEYRYSDGASFGPNTSTRVYTAALERSFTGSLPAQVTLGRFFNPVETYSGFWDGALLRLGGRTLGVGTVVGFEPDRWNEKPSTNVPKATVFSDWRVDGGAWGWQGDVSLHSSWPSDSLPKHTFAGLSQRLRAGPLRLSQDLQMDRGVDGVWKASRISLRANLNLTSALSVRASASRRESYLPWRVEDVFAPQRDRIGVGLALRAGRSYASVDVSEMRDPEDAPQRAYSGFLSVPGPFGSSLTASGSHSTGEAGTATSLAPSVMFGSGRHRLRVGYRVYRSAYLDRETLSHAPELSLDLPVAPGLRASIRIRSRFGGGLRQEALQASLIRIF